MKTYYPLTPKNPNDFECNDQTPLYDYKKSSGMPFVVNGNYRTDKADELYISYDGHPGYDYPVPEGTDILAAADGTVTKTCLNKLGELHIDHGNGLFTMYNHLSECYVDPETNKTVTKGQVIGKSGKTGASYPPSTSRYSKAIRPRTNMWIPMDGSL
ncbi:MAG: M23 family metallopeptidase [Nitrospira sp.]|nr:M23 family metallopeptidase [Nitrospira sp.]